MGIRLSPSARSGFEVRLMLCVLVGVVLASFLGMVRGVTLVRVCHMRVMAGFFVIPCLMVFCCSKVMFCGVLMMLSSFPMMFGALFRHVDPLFRQRAFGKWSGPQN